jgi:hypothetical protein
LVKVAEIRSQGAIGAMCRFAAVGLAYGNDEGVELVKKAGVASWRVGSEGLESEMDKRVVSLGVAMLWGGCKLVALDDAAKILVGHGDGMAEGVEQDSIGGLRAQAGKRKQTAAQFGGG